MSNYPGTRFSGEQKGIGIGSFTQSICLAIVSSTVLIDPLASISKLCSKLSQKEALLIDRLFRTRRISQEALAKLEGPNLLLGWPKFFVSGPCKYTNFRGRTKKICYQVAAPCLYCENKSGPSIKWCKPTPLLSVVYSSHSPKFIFLNSL